MLMVHEDVDAWVHVLVATALGRGRVDSPTLVVFTSGNANNPGVF